MRNFLVPIVVASLGLTGCDLLPEVEIDTGGDVVTQTPSDATAYTLPSGILVVGSDYTSTDIYAADTSTGLSGVLLHSGSLTSVLSTAISGDVVMSGSASRVTHEVVLIDRTNGTLTFLDTENNFEVLRQFTVGQAGDNPYDYAQVTDDTAFVALYFAAYVQIIDPRDGRAKGSVDLSDQVALSESTTATETTPNANSVVRGGDTLYVVLENRTPDYSANGTAVVVGISLTDYTIISRTELSGKENCTGAVYAPAIQKLIVACTGSYSGSQVAESGLVVLDVSNPSAPALHHTIESADLSDSYVFGGGLTLVGPASVAAVQFDSWRTGTDTVLRIDGLDSHNPTISTLYTSIEGFTLSIASHDRAIVIGDANSTEPKLHIISYGPEPTAAGTESDFPTGADRLPPRGVYPY